MYITTPFDYAGEENILRLSSSWLNSYNLLMMFLELSLLDVLSKLT